MKIVICDVNRFSSSTAWEWFLPAADSASQWSITTGAACVHSVFISTVTHQCNRQQDGEQGDVMQHQQKLPADEGVEGPQWMLLVVLVPFDAEAVVVTEVHGEDVVRHVGHAVPDDKVGGQPVPEEKKKQNTWKYCMHADSEHIYFRSWSQLDNKTILMKTNAADVYDENTSKSALISQFRNKRKSEKRSILTF